METEKLNETEIESKNKNKMEYESDYEEKEEIEEATYEDILPAPVVTKTVSATFRSNRTKKLVKMTFVIKTSVLRLDQVINSNKKLQEINPDGTIHLDLISYIIRIWPHFVVKQPVFFKEELKRFQKNPNKCILDGEIIRDILVQVYTVYRGEEETENDEAEKQVKN